MLDLSPIEDLFCPQFTLRDGLLIIRSEEMSCLVDQLIADETSMQRVELTANHRHIWDFVAFPDTVPMAIQWHFAEFVRASWMSILKADFPSIDAVVEVYEDYGPTLTAYRVRS